MNKKGAVIHWILLGLIIALGLFFLQNQKADIQPTVKGEWQLTFLENSYIPAQKELSVHSLEISTVANEIILSLLQSGGFAQQNSCGSLYWNTAQQGCFPLISRNFEELLGEKLNTLYPERGYKNLRVNGNVLTGERNIATVKNNRSFYSSYSNPASFIVNLGYDFSDFESLIETS